MQQPLSTSRREGLLHAQRAPSPALDRQDLPRARGAHPGVGAVAGVRGTWAYRLLTRDVRREEPPICWLCGHAINLALPYRNPATGQVNRWSWSLDHVEPIDERPDLALVRSNAKPAHLACNVARGKRAVRHRAHPAPQLTTSRHW